MTGIQFLTDDKGHRVAVQIDLKKHGAIWEDFWDGLISESRRKEKRPVRAIPHQPLEAQPVAWLTILSLSNRPPKKNSTLSTMPCFVASTAGFWRWPKIRAPQDARNSKAIKISGASE